MSDLASSRSLSLTGLSLAVCQKLMLSQDESLLYSSLDSLLEQIGGHLEVDAACLVIRKPGQAKFTSFLHDLHVFGLSEEERNRLSFYLAQTVVPKAVRNLESIRVADVREAVLGEIAAGYRTRMVSMLAVPMIVENEAVGIFVAFRSEIAAFCEEDESFFLKFVSLLAEDVEDTAFFLRIAKDRVTGFYNRRVFFEAVMLEASRSRRYQAPLSALVIQIDIVGQLDSELHQQFLKRLSHRIASEKRQSDIVARASQNSFLLLQPMATAENANEFAKRICRHFNENPIIIDEIHVPFSLSVGVSSLSSLDEDGSAMILRAESAASEARANGQNQTVIR